MKKRVSVAAARNTCCGLTDGDANDSDNELADQHAESTPDEQSATAEALDGPEGERRGPDVDDRERERRHKDVLNGASRLEEGSREVEAARKGKASQLNVMTDEKANFRRAPGVIHFGTPPEAARARQNVHEVDTSPLLHHLERSAEDGTTNVRARVEKRSREAGGVGGEPSSSRDHASLVLGVRDDLGEFNLDKVRCGRLASEADERVARLVELAALDVVARRVRKQEETGGEDDSPCELYRREEVSPERSEWRCRPDSPGYRSECGTRPNRYGLPCSCRQ